MSDEQKPGLLAKVGEAVDKGRLPSVLTSTLSLAFFVSIIMYGAGWAWLTYHKLLPELIGELLDPLWKLVLLVGTPYLAARGMKKA